VAYVGIDLHKNASQVCIYDEETRGYVERRVRTDFDGLQRALDAYPGARVLLEASTESEWVAQWLEELGHEVIVADPNFALMYGRRDRRIKTDRRDARALCEACRHELYRAVHRRSPERRRWQAQLRVREALVQTRTKFISQVRALLRQQGHRVPSGAARSFATRVEGLELPHELAGLVAPLLSLLAELDERIEACDEQLKQIVRDDEVVARLCTAVGVGPVTAVSFVATVDTVDRFESARSLRCYLGLVPREYSSSEHRQQGAITKQGPRRLRALLVEAAHCVLRSRREETAHLRAWAESIRARRGLRIAAVALARKLVGILLAMWRNGTPFGLPA
jgi:transposase